MNNMHQHTSPPRPYGNTLICLILSVICLASCSSQPKTSTPSISSTPAPIVGDTPPQHDAMSPTDATTYASVIRSINIDKMKKAVKTLRTLEKKYPQHVGIQINLATTHYKLGEYKQAQNVAQNARAIAENVPELHNILGLLAVKNHDFKRAESAYLKAIELDHSHADANYNLALLYDIYFQDIPKAYTYYQKYLILSPEDEATKDWVSQLKYSLDQPQ